MGNLFSKLFGWIRGLFNPKTVVPPVSEPIAPATKPIKGLDISHYQPDIVWEYLVNSAIEFVMIKATEYEKDPKFDEHWSNAKAHGILRGAYHFFHAEVDAVTQAQLFVAVVGNLDDTDLPCIMDWEVISSLPLKAQRDNAILFLTEVETLTGKTPIIYGSPSFLSQLELDDRFSKYPLWIAHYGTSTPLIPHPWTYWTFWQTSNSGRLSGIDGHVDTDLFNGTHEQLLKIARG